MPWDQTENYIRSGHRKPEDFDPEPLRTITLNEEEGIRAIIAKPWNSQSTEVVSYLFSKEEHWTTEKAQQWFNEHEKKAKESFSWSGTIRNIPQTGNLIRGKALHPIRTVHPQEWPQVREYLKEELQKSAHTLAGTPLILDHHKQINGKVLGAEYEDGAIEYVAQLDDPAITKLITDGTIKHCSVEFEWKTLEKLNGLAPRGIKFTGLSLLKDYQPGDPRTTVEVWEAIIGKLETFGVNTGFLKRNVIKSFAVDACFGALMTQTISRQIDVLLKRLDATKTFGVDAYFGPVGAETYGNNFGLDVIFAYKVRLPELWLDENGKLVLNISKPYTWVGA